MSTRSRSTTHIQQPLSNGSNSSVRIHLRSTVARDRSSPYGTLSPRSNSSKQLTSSTIAHPEENKNNTDDERHISESLASNTEARQNVVSDKSDSDESSLNESQTVHNQSDSFQISSNNKIAQNVSVNVMSSATPKVAFSSNLQKNDVVKNDEVYKSFDTVSTEVFRCKLCNKEIKSKQYHTTNLRKHIGLVHKQVEYLYPSQKRDYSKQTNSISVQKKNQLNSAIISCIITDSRSFNDFRKNGMRAFLEQAVPDFVPPHRSTIKANLIRRYRRHRQLLRNVLSNVQEIALTSDTWKNTRGTHFVCLTAHFFDSKYNMISLTLGFRQIIGDHIAERLRKYILYEVNALQIQNKLCSITTDNASNIISATANVPCFGNRFSCLAHDLNLIIQDGLHLYKRKKSGGNSVETTVLDEYDTSTSSSDEDDDDDKEEADETKLEESSGSSADSDLEEDEEILSEYFDDEDVTEIDDIEQSTDDILTNIYNLVSRARCFIRMTRRTYFIRDYIKQEAKLKNLPGEGLILDCITRWNASFYMIDRFVTYRNIINQITSNPRVISPKISSSTINQLKQFAFSYEEWEILIALRNVLAVFEEACRIISGRKYQTLSIGHMVLIGLQHHLTQTNATGPQAAIESVLRKSLYEAFLYHMNDKINAAQKRSMMIACFLDPQTHSLMPDDDKEKAQQYIINEVCTRNLTSQSISSPSMLSKNNDSDSSNIGSNKTNHPLKSFLRGCGLQVYTSRSSNGDSNRSIKEELGYYINKVKAFVTFQDFWLTHEKELPCLAVLVRSFNIRPITSVPSESLFSTAGYVNRKQRCSLSPNTLRYSMILRDADILSTLI